VAHALAQQLPDRIDLDDARHVELPFDPLGGEL
jgi:hypothetical protein